MTDSDNQRRPPLADWRKIQETLADAARLSSREIQRGVDYARRNLEKVHLLQRRKDLFSQLGRNLYEAHLDGLPPEVERFLAETEFSEIIAELKDVDSEIARRTGSGGSGDAGTRA
jgi:hypothetical protein